jgi:hypothetical protein
MYHANMQSCGLKGYFMSNLKTVGKSGQITLGKAMAGMGFVMEPMPDGDILLKRSVVIPLNEKWIHEPEMKKDLAEADEWMRNNPPQETDLNVLAIKLGIKLNEQ